jgi:hypothetical protein
MKQRHLCGSAIRISRKEAFRLLIVGYLKRNTVLRDISQAEFLSVLEQMERLLII